MWRRETKPQVADVVLVDSVVEFVSWVTPRLRVTNSKLGRSHGGERP